MSANATAAAIPIPPNISEIISPIIFSILIEWALYGALTVQLYLYYILFQDVWQLKTLVYGLYILETFQTAMLGHQAWFWLAKGFGDMANLERVGIGAVASPIVGAVNGFLVQLFFCYRIWILGRFSIWRYWAVFLGLVSFLGMFAGFTGGTVAIANGSFAVAKVPLVSATLDTYLIASAVADVLIAGTLTYILLRGRSGYNRTNLVVHRIIRLTVETNSLTAATALLIIILFYTLPQSPYVITCTYFLGKMYSNTLLVTLNNRFFIGREDRAHYSRNVHLSDLGTAVGTSGGTATINQHPPTFSNPKKRHLPVQVSTTTSTVQFADDGLTTTRDSDYDKTSFGQLGSDTAHEGVELDRFDHYQNRNEETTDSKSSV